MRTIKFYLRPLLQSRHYLEVRIYDKQPIMVQQAHRDGSIIGQFKAAHCGLDHNKTSHRIGIVYLYRNPALRRDAIHELGHAACHYVREIRQLSLDTPANKFEASFSEELLCEAMENYVGRFELEIYNRRHLL